MATVPCECLTNSGVTEAFTWQPNTVNMHLTRPKSAKGRTRASLSFSHSVESYSFRAPSPPPQDVSFEAPRRRRSSASATSSASSNIRISQEEIPEFLDQVPSRPSSSLNKYMVLPSISRKGTGDSEDRRVSERTRKPHLKDQLEEQQRKPLYREYGSTKNKIAAAGSEGPMAKTSATGSETPHTPADKPMSQPILDLEEPLEEPRLLLAVRSPSGRRYERYFRPTDSLQTIVDVTERRASTRYKNCIIEAMEVPRRSFYNLAMSLEDCGIPNKSVLYISQEEQD